MSRISPSEQNNQALREMFEQEFESGAGSAASKRLRAGYRKIVENSTVAGVWLTTSGVVDLDLVVNKSDMLSDYAESLALTYKFFNALNFQFG